MKIKAMKPAARPKLTNMRGIGAVLIIVGLAKLLDALLLTPAEDLFRPSMILVSGGAMALGGLMLFTDWMLRGDSTPLRPRSRAADSLASDSDDSDAGDSDRDDDSARPASRGSRKALGPAARGFTLIEVVVTIALIAMVFGMISGVLLSVVNVQQSINQRTDEEKIGHGVLGLLTRDLEGCVAYGMGQVVFQVEDKGLGGGDADEIAFLTTAPGDVYQDPNDPDGNNNALGGASTTNNNTNGGFGNNSGGPGGGIGGTTAGTTAGSGAARRPTRPRYRKVQYVLRESPSSRETGVESFVLLRRSVALSGANRDPTASEGPLVEVVDGLRSFKLQFKETTDSDWADGWQNPAAMPVAIRIQVTTVPSQAVMESVRAGDRPMPEPRVFETVITPLASAAIKVQDQ